MASTNPWFVVGSVYHACTKDVTSQFTQSRLATLVVGPPPVAAGRVFQVTSLSFQAASTRPRPTVMGGAPTKLDGFMRNRASRIVASGGSAEMSNWTYPRVLGSTPIGPAPRLLSGEVERT